MPADATEAGDATSVVGQDEKDDPPKRRREVGLVLVRAT
jgi:hypothetical protein